MRAHIALERQQEREPRRTAGRELARARSGRVASGAGAKRACGWWCARCACGHKCKHADRAGRATAPGPM
eukprot:scaffold129611_cov33-Tisochrysis_lutea.AAC.1